MSFIPRPVVAALMISTPLAASAQTDIYSHTYLFPSDGDSGDQFGHRCDLKDGVLAVGARYDSDNAWRCGSVYLYDASTGSFITKIIPEEIGHDEQFGADIALGGGLLAVGVASRDENGEDSGAVYLFEAATGAPMGKLIPEDNQAGDNFGSHVAIENGMLFVGASGDDSNDGVPIPDVGSIYVYDVETLAFIKQFFAVSPVAGCAFGGKFATDGVSIASRANCPSAVVYAFDIETGAHLSTMTLWPGYGHAMALYGYRLAISNPYDDNGRGTAAGAVDMYNIFTGNRVQRLYSIDGTRHDYFGKAMDIQDGVIAITSPGDGDVGVNVGSARLYDAYTMEAYDKLYPSVHQGINHDEAGDSIAMDGTNVALGSPTVYNTGRDAGLVYLFRIEECPGDLTTTGTGSGDAGFGQPDSFTNLSDLLFFVNAWNTDIGTPSPNPASLADVTSTGASTGDPGFGVADGNVDLSDLLFYVNDWTVGLTECP